MPLNEDLSQSSNKVAFLRPYNKGRVSASTMKPSSLVWSKQTALHSRSLLIPPILTQTEFPKNDYQGWAQDNSREDCLTGTKTKFSAPNGSFQGPPVRQNNSKTPSKLS